MIRIIIWASIQYAVHVNGATIHVTGPEERQVEFGDGTSSFATLSGGEGYINSTVNVYAPDFVTMTGTSVEEMIALIRAQQVIITAQADELRALKHFVGMQPPSLPPSTPPMAPIIEVQPGRNTLQSAHDQASEGTILLLAEGTYYGSGWGSVISITKSITLRAAHLGGLVVLHGERHGERRVVEIQNTDAIVELNGLEITGGYTARGTKGAGIYISGHSSLGAPFVIISQCKIHNNQAGPVGGGSPRGAGLYVQGATVRATDSIISDNFCSDQWNGNGGGIQLISQAVLNITRCSILNNRASNSGGGFNVINSQLNMRDCDIKQNEAGHTAWWDVTGSTTPGGGIFAQGSTTRISIIGSNFSENIAKTIQSDIHVSSDVGSVCTLDTEVHHTFGVISTCRTDP